MAHLRTFVALAALATATAGCRNQRDVIEAHEAGEGTTVLYPVDRERAFRAIVEVLEDEGASSVTPRRDEGYVAADFGVSVFSWGTLVGVWARPAGDGTDVTVVTLRRLATNVVTRLTEETFHERLRERLTRER